MYGRQHVYSMIFHFSDEREVFTVPNINREWILLRKRISGLGTSVLIVCYVSTSIFHFVLYFHIAPFYLQFKSVKNRCVLK